MYQGYIINSVSDPEFYARAYEDWCNKRAEDQAKLLQLVTSSLEIADKYTDVESDSVAATAIANDLIKSYGDLSQIIPVPNGYVSSTQYCMMIAQSVRAYSQGKDAGVVADSYLPDGTILPYTIDISNEIERVTTDLHSIIALTAANAAAHCDNVVDRIATFRDKMSRVFANGYTDLSNSSDYYVQLLEGVSDYDEYMSSIYQSTNIEAIAADNSSVSVTQNDIYQYTGASPAGPLSFATVSETVQSVANAGAKMLKAVFNKVKTVVGKLFRKVKKYVNETLVNPYDVKEDENGVAPSIANFSVSLKEYTRIIPSDFSAFGSNAEAEALITEMAAQTNNVLKIATVFGEVIFNVLGYESTSLGPKVKYNMDFKPYSITDYTYRQFYQVMSDQFTLAPITQGVDNGVYKARFPYSLHPWEELSTALNNSLYNITDKYCSTKDSEEELYRGFVRSVYAMCNVMEMARYEMLYPEDPDGQELSCLISPDKINSTCSGPFTNLDFIKIGSFWNGSAFQISPDIIWSSDEPTQAATMYIFFGGVKGLIGLFLDIVIGVKLQNDLNPGTAPFISYRSNKEGLSVSRFVVKTDAENQEAFNNFVVGCVVAIVAVVVVATCAVAAKKIVRSISQKALAKKSVLDSKMWNGETLTKAEWRSYRMSNRLASLGASASSVLQSGSSSILSTLQQPDTFSLIYQKITGETL